MMDVQPPRLVDYHMHTAVTTDGNMNEREACERAVLQGIREIAFTNHLMLKQPKYFMSRQDCLAHWERIQECQERYPELGIRLGVEMDYYPDREQDIAATVHDYEQLLGRPFDLVLGSIHELNGIFFSNKLQAPKLYADRDPVTLYCEYFGLATQAVRSRLFDVMAHPDLIKKYTYELSPPTPFPGYRQAAELYVNALVEMGVGMELNTKGLKLKVDEAYPSNELLELYLSKAGAADVEPILTLGSDAHHMDEVGNYLLEGVAIFRSLGVKAISTFKGHVRSAWGL